MSISNSSSNETSAGLNKAKALELALSTIEKQFGKGSIMKLGEGRPSFKTCRSSRPAA